MRSFVVTYRDDEIGRTHPVRLLLGDLARVPGSPESPRATDAAAVAELAAAPGSTPTGCTR